jgi:hypothetical protein
MDAVIVSGLKNNPSQALRMARKGVVLVMNGNKPEALMVSIDSCKVLDVTGVRPALATAMFRNIHLSLARAAKLGELPLRQLVFHTSRLGIAVVNGSAEDTLQDMETLEQRLALSYPQPTDRTVRRGCVVCDGYSHRSSLFRVEDRITAMLLYKLVTYCALQCFG